MKRIKLVNLSKSKVSIILTLFLVSIMASYLIKNSSGLLAVVILLGFVHFLFLVGVMIKSWRLVSAEKSHYARWDLLVLTGVNASDFLTLKTKLIRQPLWKFSLLIYFLRLPFFLSYTLACLLNLDSCGLEQPPLSLSLLINGSLTIILMLILTIYQLRYAVVCGVCGASIAYKRPPSSHLVAVTWLTSNIITLVMLLIILLPLSIPPTPFYDTSPLHQRAFFVQSLIIILGVALFDYGLLSNHLIWYSGVLQTSPLFNPALVSLLLSIVIYLILAKILTHISLRACRLQGLL